MKPYMPHIIADELRRRVLVLDGAMGTMIMCRGLAEADFAGNLGLEKLQQGNNDLLTLTRPDVILDIHRAYVEAGADIISTDTFGANAVSQADYGTVHLVNEMNREGARLARLAADEAMHRQPGRHVWVAGSMGPTNRMASMSPDVADPSRRDVTYDELREACRTQAAALIEGGVDLLLLETVFDTLNLKAALDGAAAAMDTAGRKVEIMVSATVSDTGGRLLTGQTLEALAAAVAHRPEVVSLGVNCSFGAGKLLGPLRTLSECAPRFVSCHPNAGLPDRLGNYDESPEAFARHCATILAEGLVNIVGGCCGTTPAHIAALRAVADTAVPRPRGKEPRHLVLSGLEPLEVCPQRNFTNVGERCNVAGSRKFLRLIREKKYDEAVAAARLQVQQGALAIDVNMDDALLDARAEMQTFLRWLAADPDTARVPVMVDSSDWDVAEAGLKCLQGKGIVNSISLKEGESVFLDHARRARRLGAAVVVMAFDEQGQADTFARKTEICARAYRLLTEKAGYPGHDIIFDPNIMAVATGIEAHDRYASDYIEAVRWIKANLPGALTSGGVSNLSFAFRGNNPLREAMHAVFLRHAVEAGLDMGILNPATSVAYDSIEPGLRTLIEDTLLCRRPGAAADLAGWASANMPGKDKPSAKPVEDCGRASVPVAERLSAALQSGEGRWLEADLAEIMDSGATVTDVVEGPLMRGMDQVGRLFAEGSLFLPQVVRSARVMKQAVEILRPYMEDNASMPHRAGRVVFATVKGDVHDIGKNITATVLGCNGYEVTDMGVSVAAEDIVAEAVRSGAEAVCLSGLITPSLAEMAKVAVRMQAAGLRIPLFVGGAATSPLHTALRIAPVYDGPVVHAADAAGTPGLLAQMLGGQSAFFASRLRHRQQQLAEAYGNSPKALLPLAEARGLRLELDWTQPSPVPVQREALWSHIPLDELEPLLNRRMFLHSWGMAEVAGSDEARKLWGDALAMLGELKNAGLSPVKGAVKILDAASDGENVTLYGPEATVALPMLRRQTPGQDGRCASVADMVRREGGDYAGVFVATSAHDWIERETDPYRRLLAQTLADRLAEAASEWLHARVRRQVWGYAPGETATPAELLQGRYQGIRPAVGYGSIPDQTLMRCVAPLLPLQELGVEVTENGALGPAATVCGLYLWHPGARNFNVGLVGDDQAEDYGLRRGFTAGRLKEILGRRM